LLPLLRLLLLLLLLLLPPPLPSLAPGWARGCWQRCPW
jgi:hypothetical protein